MKNKGFVLMETIVVIVVISVALLTIFSSYNKILSKVKSENKYDTSEYIYMTKHIKDYLKNNSCVTDIYEMGVKDKSTDPNRKKILKNYYNSDCGFAIDDDSKNIFNIKKIYILKYLNEINEGTIKDAENFDAYMIDYIKKLDVNDSDTLIIVEYKRPAYDIKFTQKEKFSSIVDDDEEKKLYETYIASLEW